MTEEFGIINVEVARKKTDPEIIKKLFARLSKEDCSGCENPYTEEAQVKTLMLYNVWTVKQFSDVSGLDVSTVTNYSRPAYVGNKIGTKIDICYPYPDSDGKGPKFIVRNAKSEQYIKY
jgi:hypothetical protein